MASCFTIILIPGADVRDGRPEEACALGRGDAPQRGLRGEELERRHQHQVVQADATLAGGRRRLEELDTIVTFTSFSFF